MKLISDLYQYYCPYKSVWCPNPFGAALPSAQQHYHNRACIKTQETASCTQLHWWKLDSQSQCFLLEKYCPIVLSGEQYPCQSLRWVGSPTDSKTLFMDWSQSLCD